MSSKLNHIGYDIRGPIVDEADQMIEHGIKVIKLNTGNPAPFDFQAPQAVIDSLIANIQTSQGYSHSKGIIEAREAIAGYCSIKGIPDVTANDIYTGNGISELISMSMQALLDTGDEILIPTPDYPLWTSAATLAGGTVVHYLCDEQAEWYPDIQDMRRKITSKTKAIVIINPNNPTGAVYPKELLLEIVQVARGNHLMIFSDEIYDRLVMDELEHTSIASLAPDLFVVTLNGLSKSHRIAGFRCGWICLSGDKKGANSYIQGLSMLASMRLCSSVLSQSVIKAALDDYNNANDLLRPGGRIYDQRQYITAALNNIPGITAVKPKAAFYIFPKVEMARFNFRDDEQLVLNFLREKHILLTHGRGFNWNGADHFRVVYLPRVDELKEIIDSLVDFLDHYKKQGEKNYGFVKSIEAFAEYASHTRHV
jgi:alanine-synthesizing transaminase